MIYEFQDVETGEFVDIEMSMHNAVDIGKVITRKGRKLKRLPSLSMEPCVQRDPHFVAVSQQAKYTKEEQDATGHPHWENDKSHWGYGCPKFSSRGEIKEYLKRNGGVYDADGGINAVKP